MDRPWTAARNSALQLGKSWITRWYGHGRGGYSSPARRGPGSETDRDAGTCIGDSETERKRRFLRAFLFVRHRPPGADRPGANSSSRVNELRPSAPRRAVPWGAAGPVPDDSTGHGPALCPPRPPLAHGTGGSVPSFEKLAQRPRGSSGQHERRVASLWTDRGCAAGSGLQSSKLVDNWAWRDGDAASIVGPARRGPGSETDPGRRYLYRRLGNRAEPAVPSGVSISVGCSDGWRRRRPSARRPGTWLA